MKTKIISEINEKSTIVSEYGDGIEDYTIQKLEIETPKGVKKVVLTKEGILKDLESYGYIIKILPGWKKIGDESVEEAMTCIVNEKTLIDKASMRKFDALNSKLTHLFVLIQNSLKFMPEFRGILERYYNKNIEDWRGVLHEVRSGDVITELSREFYDKRGDVFVVISFIKDSFDGTLDKYATPSEILELVAKKGDDNIGAAAQVVVEIASAKGKGLAKHMLKNLSKFKNPSPQ